MSSPSSPQSTVLSDPTTGPDDGGGGMQRGASYFFGFLITFVVLLLVFVGCGVVSRRRFAARRRARFEWDMEPWAERIGGDVGYVPPVLLEKTIVRGKNESLWKDLNPLAALVVIPNSEKQIPDSGSHVLPSSHSTTWPQSPRPPSTYAGRDIGSDLQVISRTLSSTSRTRPEPLTRITSGNSGLVRITSPTPYHRNPNVILAQHEAEQGQHRQHDQLQEQEQEPEQEQETISHEHGLLYYLNPTSWLRRLRRRRREEREQANDMERGVQGVTCDEKLQEEENEKKPKALQVAMLIEMPSQPSHSVEGGQPVAEYQVGIANISWSDDLKDNLNLEHEHWSEHWSNAQSSSHPSD